MMPTGNAQENSDNSEANGWQLSQKFRAGLNVIFLLGIGQGCALLSLLLISRFMEDDAFGQISSGLAIQSYVVLIGTLGLRTIVTRDLARNPERLGSIWGTLWLITVVFGIGIAASGHFLSGVIFSRPTEEIWMSLWLSVGACFSIISVVPLLDALGRQRLALLGVAITEVFFLISLFCGWITPKIEVVGAAFAIKWIFASILQAILLFKTTNQIRWSFDSELVIQWSKSAPPLLLTSLVMTMPITGAVIITRSFLGESESAAIGLAGQLAGAILLLGGVAVRFIQPRWRDTESLHNQDTKKFVFQIALCGVFSWIACVIIASLVITFWLPMTYSKELLSIQLMLLAGGLAVIARLLWIALLAANRENDVMIAYASGCCVFLILSFVLMQSSGKLGVAIAAAAGSLVTVLFMWRKAEPLLMTRNRP